MKYNELYYYNRQHQKGRCCKLIYVASLLTLVLSCLSLFLKGYHLHLLTNKKNESLRCTDRSSILSYPAALPPLKIDMECNQNKTSLYQTPSDGAIAPHHFKYTLNNENMCKNVSNLFYFVFVFSKPESFTIRSTIRDSWGRPNLFRGMSGRVAFMLGVTSHNGIARLVRRESEKYGDIIQQDFVDAYRNLSLKGIMASKWIYTYCKGAKYIVKVDDDVVLNIVKMGHYLLETVSKTKRSIHCYILPEVLRKHFVIRPNTTKAALFPKFIVTKKQYPRSMYPEYCHGMLWVSTNDIFRDLYLASCKIPLVPTEDAFTTGVLREYIGDVKIINKDEFYKTVGKPIKDIQSYSWENKGLPIALSVERRVYMKTWENMLCQLNRTETGLLDIAEWKEKHFRFCKPQWLS